MSVNEPDFELLEAYLDDELSEVEADDLRRRIEADRELGDALAALRGERSARQRYWEALEPDASSADQFAAGIVDEAMARDRFGRRMRWMKWSGAVAACLAMFVAGRMTSQVAAPIAPVVPVGPVAGTKDEAPREIQFPGITVGDIARGNQVELTDEQGRVVAVQKFRTVEQAREFSNDLQRWQNARRQAKDGQIVPVSGERF